MEYIDYVKDNGHIPLFLENIISIHDMNDKAEMEENIEKYKRRTNNNYFKL